MTPMKRARIVGVGAYVPDRVIKNDDLKQWMETSDEWIVQRTGIKERHWVTPEQSTSDLALEASLAALKSAGLDKSKIDLIIFATLSPDHLFPGSGCYLQSKLGLNDVPALDIRQQCSGFLYGLSIADQFIRTGMYSNVLLVGAEVHSKGLDISTKGRDVSVLFGDGAGAVVLTATEVTDPTKQSFIWSTRLHADGSHAEELWAPAPGTAMPGGNWLDEKMVTDGKHFPQMNGKRVFTSAVRRMSESLTATLMESKVTVADVDLFLFHQANLRINEAVADQLQIPREKVFNTIQHYGNTTAATIPLGMRDAVAKGVLKPGMLVGLAAFGSGFTWSSALLRF
jgi:3-oxoacyl-[acyl-carrier-protein] synthase-3